MTFDILTFNIFNFDILTFNILTFDILPFDVLTFDILTFNILTFHILDLIYLIHDMYLHHLDSWGHTRFFVAAKTVWRMDGPPLHSAGLSLCFSDGVNDLSRIRQRRFRSLRGSIVKNFHLWSLYWSSFQDQIYTYYICRLQQKNLPTYLGNFLLHVYFKGDFLLSYFHSLCSCFLQI
jgi:hypothetical protein